MSSICGVRQLHDRPGGASARCRQMQVALAPYGRHAQAQWDSAAMAMGSRLSLLLPEDRYDRQPLQDASGRFVLVADVRLDNREALAHTLGLPASQASRQSDADILLAAYLHWQHDTPAQLLGDFAFAVWDRQQRSLFLARDQLGNCPLFYHHGQGWFGFASMPAGLLALDEVPRGCDETRLSELLLLLPETSANSFHAGIQRLLPGCCARLDANGQLHGWRYWSVPTSERLHYPRDEDYVDAFVAILQEAVRCRLRSYGGVASQLSAGFDSGTITSVAARLLAADNRPLLAYTSVPDPARLPPQQARVLDEGPLAAQLAAHFPNVQHHLLRTDGHGLVAAFAHMTQHYNRPARNIVNQLWLSAINQQAAAHGATTVLCAAAGNFTISYHGWHHLNALLRERQWPALWQALRQGGGGLRGQLQRYYQTLQPSLPAPLQAGLHWLRSGRRSPRDPLADVLHPELLQRYRDRLQQAAAFHGQQLESRYWRQQMLARRDPGEYNKGLLAESGVSRRDPSSDVRLIHYCQAIPVSQFRHGRQDRWLLRRALARYWPATLQASRARGVQSADWQYRLRQEQAALGQLLATATGQPLLEGLLSTAALQAHMHRLAGDDGHASQFNPGNHVLRLLGIAHFIHHSSG